MTAAPPPAAAEQARRVREMFGAVARRYDLLNHVLSAGLDRRWRRRAARTCAQALAGQGAACPGTSPDEADRPVVLDICAGTGDLAMEVLREMPEAGTIACDFCRPMLERARRKLDGVGLAGRAAVLEADALALPLGDGSVDAATCGFGLRNLADVARGLAEMVRVVRPGGAVVILEFHRPRLRGGLAAVFGLYFRRILPRLGAWVSGDDRGAYRYLVESIDAFGPPQQTAAALEAAGLGEVRVEPLPGGVASVFVGRKPL